MGRLCVSMKGRLLLWPNQATDGVVVFDRLQHFDLLREVVFDFVGVTCFDYSRTSAATALLAAAAQKTKILLIFSGPLL